jgi:hypothetical protein
MSGPSAFRGQSTPAAKSQRRAATGPARDPKPEEVRNVEVSWLLAVDELANSLKSVEKPKNNKGRAFLLHSDIRLETQVVRLQ